MQALCDIYANRRYLLTWRDRKGKVLLEQEASSDDVLLAVWQVSCQVTPSPGNLVSLSRGQTIAYGSS